VLSLIQMKGQPGSIVETWAVSHSSGGADEHSFIRSLHRTIGLGM